jgi:hypothetical protein
MLEWEKDVAVDVIVSIAGRSSDDPRQLPRLSAVVRLIQLFWKIECTRAERSDRIVPRY